MADVIKQCRLRHILLIMCSVVQGLTINIKTTYLNKIRIKSF